MLVGLFVPPATARPDGPACGEADGVPARVAAVEPGLELVLADGRRLAVAGIDPPRPTPDHPDLAEAARQALAAWLVGRDVMVRPLAAAADRWNRWPALVFVAADAPAPAAPAAPPRLSVAEALLDAGWARMRPDAALHGCASTFLSLEAGARAERLGLWADAFYGVVPAGDRAALALRTGGMALIEGVAGFRAGRFRSALTLAPGTGGFAATASPHGVALLAKAGLDLQRLVGKHVRIRGFLDDRFGLRIELTTPDQVEILDP